MNIFFKAGYLRNEIFKIFYNNIYLIIKDLKKTKTLELIFFIGFSSKISVVSIGLCSFSTKFDH